MSAEENRRIALLWVEYLTENRLDDLVALGAPDATWWVSGLKETSPLVGTYPYADRKMHLEEAFKGRKTFTFSIRGSTAEGDTVVVEGSPRAEFQDGRIYKNDVVLIFVIKNGKIQSLREYLDLFAVLKLMGANNA